MSFGRWRDLRANRKALIEDARIATRDIIIKQPSGTTGEFALTKNNGETKDKLLARMYEHIKTCANIGLKAHLNDNFTHPKEYQNQFALRVNLEKHFVILPKQIADLANQLEPGALDLKAAEQKLRLEKMKQVVIDANQVRLEAAKQVSNEYRSNNIEMKIDLLKERDKTTPRWKLRQRLEAQIAPIRQEDVVEIAKQDQFIRGELKNAEMRLRSMAAEAAVISPQEIRATAKQEMALQILRKLRQDAIEENMQKLSNHKSVMMREHKNNLTRVILTEFSFYPQANQGPLTEEDFGFLIGKIEHLACAYPENLHLLLASFPVVDKQNQVFNIVLYVQCGPQPQMAVHAKFNPSHIDPVYPGTKLPFVTQGSSGSKLSSDINALVSEIDLDIRRHPQMVDVAKFAELKRLCSSNSDYIYVLGSLSKQPELVREYDWLIEYIDELKNIKGNDEIKTHVEYIVNFASKFAKKVSERSAQYATVAAETTAINSLFANLPSAGGSAKVYANEVPITTAGGARAGVSIEVCLEHHESVALSRMKAAIAKFTEERVRIQKSISQIITSNSIVVEPEKIIGANIVQADPQWDGVSVKNTKGTLTAKPLAELNTKFDTKFGCAPFILTYAPYVLDQLPDQLLRAVDLYNRAADKIEALRLYHHQHPNEAGQATEQIEAKINSIMLAYYTQVGDVVAVEKILKKKVDINYQDEEGNTALHLVLRNPLGMDAVAQENIRDALLKSGASIILPNNNNYTVLDLAAKFYDNNMMLALCQHGSHDQAVKDIEASLQEIENLQTIFDDIPNVKPTSVVKHSSLFSKKNEFFDASSPEDYLAEQDIAKMLKYMQKVIAEYVKSGQKLNDVISYWAIIKLEGLSIEPNQHEVALKSLVYTLESQLIGQIESALERFTIPKSQHAERFVEIASLYPKQMGSTMFVALMLKQIYQQLKTDVPKNAITQAVTNLLSDSNYARYPMLKESLDASINTKGLHK